MRTLLFLFTILMVTNTAMAIEQTDNYSSSSRIPDRVDPPVIRETVKFPYYTCGIKYTTNDPLGHYFDGTRWQNPTEPDYLDKRNDGSVVSRGYKQCGGEGTTQNCLDMFGKSEAFPERKFCGNGIGAQAIFTRGEVSPDINFVISGGNRIYKVVFHPLVDQFALLQVVDSFAGFAGNTEVASQSAQAISMFGHYGTAFQVEINGVVSDYRHRYKSIANLDSTFTYNADGSVSSTVISGEKMCVIVPFWTIVVKMTKGVIDSIEFDDDDTTCASELSVDRNCGTKITECTASPIFSPTANLKSADCDFKVYISWQGTDSAGTFLTSSGRRLSQFRRWSLSAAYKQASSFDTGELPAVEPANPSG